MNKIQQLMHDDMQKLDTVIRNDLSSNVVLINQIGEYIVSAGGKRIRPLLTLLCGRIAGIKDNDLIHQIAAMIEYIHTATLLHDDVVDESGLRRGRKTSNAVFGNAASVLVGDFIYTRAFQMMVKSDSIRVLDVMAKSTNQISEGEVLQLLNIGRSDLTEKEYFEVIKYKTAILFEASARVAAIIANTSSKEEEALANYAINIGTAFQIVDDILDYTGDSNSMGKNVGDDLLEGKVTLPLIYLLKNGSALEQQKIKDAIDKPNTAEVDFIISAIKNSGAIKYCSNLAQHYVDSAISELTIFPDSEYKDAMIELSHSAVERIT
jgi:octaprenyl-diphosphate synthase